MKKNVEDGYLESLVTQVLLRLGADIRSDNFRDTPRRVVEMWKFVFGKNDEKLDLKIFSSRYEGMIVVKNIRVNGLCPHHLLAVQYDVSFAYIPRYNKKKKRSKVLGLSKVVRYIQSIGSQVVLQEDFTEEVVGLFQEKINPLGCMVVVKGVHSCMTCRGIEKADVSVVTSAIRGVFSRLEVKEEALFFFKEI